MKNKAKRNKRAVKKTDDPAYNLPKEALDNLEEFTEKLKNDDYMAHFLLTLEINKIEAAHQKSDQPMIFLKELDQDGVVATFTVNPTYKGRVPAPKTDFTEEEVCRLRDHLLANELMIVKLAVMLTIGNLEYVFLSMLSPEEHGGATPPFLKQFDDFGISTAYKINWPVEAIGAPNTDQ